MSIINRPGVRESYAFPNWLRTLITVGLRWLPAVLIVVAVVGFWEAYVRIFDVQKWLLPAPTVIAKTIGVDAGLLWVIPSPP